MAAVLKLNLSLSLTHTHTHTHTHTARFPSPQSTLYWLALISWRLNPNPKLLFILWHSFPRTKAQCDRVNSTHTHSHTHTHTHARTHTHTHSVWEWWHLSCSFFSLPLITLHFFSPSCAHLDTDRSPLLQKLLIKVRALTTGQLREGVRWVDVCCCASTSHLCANLFLSLHSSLNFFISLVISLSLSLSPPAICDERKRAISMNLT